MSTINFDNSKDLKDLANFNSLDSSMLLSDLDHELSQITSKKEPFKSCLSKNIRFNFPLIQSQSPSVLKIDETKDVSSFSRLQLKENRNASTISHKPSIDLPVIGKLDQSNGVVSVKQLANRMSIIRRRSSLNEREDSIEKKKELQSKQEKKKSILIEDKRKKSVVMSWFNNKFMLKNSLPPIIYSENKKNKLRAKYHSLGKLSDIVIECDNCLENFARINEFTEGITEIMDQSIFAKDRASEHKKEVSTRKVILPNQFYNYVHKEEEKRSFKKRIDLDVIHYRNIMKEKFGLMCFQDEDYDIYMQNLKDKIKREKFTY